jgi:TPR repeat protein
MTIPATVSHATQSPSVNVYSIRSWLLAGLLILFCSPGWAAAAPEWFHTMAASCESGVTQDCLNAAVALKKGELSGKKIKQDPVKSKYYVDKAVRSGEKNCKQGDTLDCYTIGLLYFEGGGVIPTDFPRGLDMLQRSCRGGYKKACEWLDNSGLQI